MLLPLRVEATAYLRRNENPISNGSKPLQSLRRCRTFPCSLGLRGQYSDLEGGEEVAGEPVVTGCDAPEVFQPVEHALDGVSTAVQIGREAAFPAALDLGRDVGRGSLGLDLPAHGVGVVALVPLHQVGRRHLVQQSLRSRAVGDLAAGQQEGDRTARRVGQGVDLRRPPAAGLPDRLTALPHFPPEAQRCAFTAELSIRSSAGGPPAPASAWNMSAQTPLAAHRWKRLYRVLRGP